MSVRFPRFAAALCGLLGFAALGVYYAVPFPLPPPDASLSQLTEDLRGYQNTIFLDAWLLATGSLLQVVFVLALVRLAGTANQFWGILTILASTIILAVSLFDSAFTIAGVEAARNGHPATSLVCFDMTNSMRHVFLVAPSLFLPLGLVLIGSRLLPRLLGYVALALGVAFQGLGFASFFSDTAAALIIGLLIGQELWMLVAPIVLAFTELPAIEVP